MGSELIVILLRVDGLRQTQICSILLTLTWPKNIYPYMNQEEYPESQFCCTRRSANYTAI